MKYLTEEQLDKLDSRSISLGFVDYLIEKQQIPLAEVEDARLIGSADMLQHFNNTDFMNADEMREMFAKATDKVAASLTHHARQLDKVKFKLSIDYNYNGTDLDLEAYSTGSRIESEQERRTRVQKEVRAELKAYRKEKSDYAKFLELKAKFGDDDEVKN